MYSLTLKSAYVTAIRLSLLLRYSKPFTSELKKTLTLEAVLHKPMFLKFSIHR